jgi:hypothetical protein
VVAEVMTALHKLLHAVRVLIDPAALSCQCRTKK